MCAVMIGALILRTLVACSPETRDVRGADPTDTAAGSAGGRGLTLDSLNVTLNAPDEIRLGAPITFTLQLRNASARPLDVYLRGREITFDVIVRDSTGREVWNRLHEQIIPAIVRVETMAPGASLELRHVWDQRGNDRRNVAPGAYVAHGLVLTEGEPIRTAERRLVILP